MGNAVDISDSLIDERIDVTPIIGREEAIDRVPILPDPVAFMVRECYRDQPAFGHDVKPLRAAIKDRPGLTAVNGCRVFFDEPPQPFDRHADTLCRLPLTRALLHQCEGLLQRIIPIDARWWRPWRLTGSRVTARLGFRQALSQTAGDSLLRCRNREISDLARGSVVASPNDETACETLDDIEAASRTAGFEAPSEHQLERWRGEGLLPHACQIPQAYRGSIVRHPVGTAKQAELASEDQEEILRNFGIKHYGTRQIEPVHLNVMGNNWSAPDWTSVFHQTIQIFTEMSPKDIQDLDIEELNLIREKTKSVFDSVQIISRHFSAIGFKNAFGFRLISLISSIGGSFRGGFVFLIYLWSKQDNNRADFLEYERIIAPFADLLRHLHVDSRNQTVRNIDTGAIKLTYLMEKAPGLNIAEAKSEDDLDWLSRSVHWGNFHAETRPATTRLRSAIRLPLILTGHGVRLRVDHGALVVRDGFTHYPQTVEDRHLFPGAVDLPSRIIVVDGSGGLTFDVLDWLATQSIPLVRIDWKGSVRAVVVGSGFSANPSQVLWQRETRADPVRRVEFTRRLIRRKLVSSLQTLEAAFRGFRKLEEAQSRIQAQIDRLESDPPRDIPTLMGIEANAAATYFRFWKDITLKWKRVPGRVIPDNWRQFTARRSILLDSSNRKAADPINAMLNYAYAVLQSHMQIQLVAD
eukprot:gene19567-20008_t